MKLLICNLKMNHTLKEMIAYKKIIEENSLATFLLCPAICYLPLMHSKKYSLCAQNISLEEEQHYTGEVSASALKSLDVNSVLIGHAEVNDSLRKKIEKIKYSLKNKMHVYVVLSETKEEYDYQYTSVKLLGMIRAILSKVSFKDYAHISFIYEPTWLIGGDIAIDACQVNRLFEYLKQELQGDYKTDFLFLYGGGLNKTNISSFLSQPSVDGLLLGSYCNNAKNVVKVMQSEYFST